VNTLVFNAHSENCDGKAQRLSEHLNNVAMLASQFAEAFCAGETAKVLGILHDLGKRDPLFQKVLRQQAIHVNHSAAGAAVVRQMYEGFDSPLLLSSVLYAHHGSLRVDDGLAALLRRELTGSDEPYDEDHNHLTLIGAAKLTDALRAEGIKLPNPKKLQIPPFHRDNDLHIQRMLWMRLLLSVLVDADYCDTAQHYGTPFAEVPLDIPAALRALERKHDAIRSASTAATTLNTLREQLYQDCRTAADKPRGVYTLTAPTGMGKTLSLLQFALRHAAAHGLRRVIVILPYLSLMQQNVAVYREILPDLLESHSMAVWNEETRHLAERWEAPLIVTTSVQFFEALFKNRAPDCRKLHQLAKSVIVFDEAQTLPSHLLPPTLQSLRALHDLAGCTVVFSTATQPSYDQLTQVGWHTDEIVQNVPALYRATRRVTVDWRTGKPIALETLAEEIGSQQQCLVIVNLRKHARTLAGALETWTEKGSLFYLTTDLCIRHRTAVLEEVHRRLANGLPCTLVATQCVEAGVDLDFPVLYRALGPLESIIQAAGRCNRNGAAPDGRVTVFIPDTEGTLYPSDWYQWQSECVQEMLSQGPVDLQNPEQIRMYFDLCYRQGTPETPELTQAIQMLDFATVARKYRLIDGGQYHVVVPYGKVPVTLDSVLAQGLTPKTMRLLRPCVVSTYSHNAPDFCDQLPLKIPGGFPSKDGSSWYWLGSADLYDGTCFGLQLPQQPTSMVY